MRPALWKAAGDIAGRQLQLVTAAQLAAAGWPERTVRRAIASGLLVVVRRGVFALGGADVDARRTLLAACLAAGPAAVASHASAAWLWGFDGVLPDPSR